MKVAFENLNRTCVRKLVIESVDLSLYIAFAVIDGKEHVVTNSRGQVLKTFNLLDMRRKLSKVVDCGFFLRQRSAYDEMVGHQYDRVDNCMELPIDREPIARWLD